MHAKEKLDLTDESPAVRLELDSRPETLTLVRGVLAGVAELIGLDPELLDDLKTAVSEACNNVVMHAYDGETGPLIVRMYIDAEAIEVVVVDRGSGLPPLAPADETVRGVGLSVIRALAERAEFRAVPDGGTEVRMAFAGQRDGKPLFHLPSRPGPDDQDSGWLAGDAVVSLSPISLLAGVLGRVARALAARARFSLDRFSDVYLVTDAIAAHAGRAANGSRMSFAISTDTQRLELTIGPFLAGSGEQLSHQAPDYSAASALTMLSDELEVRQDESGEVLYVVMVDRRRN
ncbi:MAG TPA: ATP-binding protein [Solirubrobacteraceae bacterium]|nr:ATP-binding protein [Solirubrobacteraceae bacterium]